MRKGGGRAKGAGFELKLARLISAWWCQNPEYATAKAADLPFRRTPLSGGWDKTASADIMVTDVSKMSHPFCFSIEAKCQECWDFAGIFNDKWPVKAYWDQCVEASKKNGLEPLVIFTKNHSPIYFAARHWMARVVGLENALTFGGHPFSIGRFDDLLKASPQQIVAKVEDHRRLRTTAQALCGLAAKVSGSSKQADAGTPAMAARPEEPRCPASGVQAGEPKHLPKPEKVRINEDRLVKTLKPIP